MKASVHTKGKLYLIPNLISDKESEVGIEIRVAIKNIGYYLAETPKSARRFLRKADKSIPLESLNIETYNKSTNSDLLEELMKPLMEGHDMGIITDSGIPGIADPGNLAVEIAHRWRVEVKPLTGPSSIILALAGSGFNGQHFCFHGYLPVAPKECASKIRKLEADSSKNNCSQIFIETPYRNEKLLKLLQSTLRPETKLCLAYDITGSNETIISKGLKEWKHELFSPGKLPCVFIIYSGS